ncbi:MAG TPA: tyrosine-type recombinase/integrase [Opitutaceae bacterium]
MIGEIMVLGGMGQGLAEFTVEQWVQGWLAEKKATTSTATHRAYQTSMRGFLKQLGDRKDRHLETITAADIRTYRDETKKDGRAARTANLRIKILRSCFADAVKASAILQNPADGVKTLEESDSTERVPFEIDQIPKLLDAAPSDDWRGVILVGLYAALRLGDAATLKAANVNLEARTITLIPAKTRRKKRALTIPMHPDLVAFFEPREVSPFPGTPLFPSLAAQSVGGKQGLSIQFGRIMDAAGVPRMTSRKSADGAARDMNQLSFHSLRHTTASLMANAGVSAELRMKITGHTSVSVHASYTHLAEEAAAKAVKAMPSLRRKAAH